MEMINNQIMDTDMNKISRVTPEKEEQMMAIMKKLYEEAKPKVGIFWYDNRKNELFGVLKDFAHNHRNNKQFSTLDETHRHYWDEQHNAAVATGDKSSPFFNYQNYKQIPRCRACGHAGEQYTVAVGDWFSGYSLDDELQLRDLISDEFNLPYDFDFVIDETLNLNREWNEQE